MGVHIGILKGVSLSGADCPSCKPGESYTFTGLRLRRDNGPATFIRWPFQVEQVGTTAVVSWDQDKKETIKLNETTFSSMAGLMAALRSFLDGDNGLISEWPKGDVSVDGAANDLTLTTTGNITLDAGALLALNVPEYADDAAAAADGDFPSSGIYTTTGSTALKIKP